MRGDSELVAPGSIGKSTVQCKQSRGAGDLATNKDELRTRVPGKWFFCPDAAGFTKTEGIEITEDGHFWELSRVGETLVRKPGVEFSGTWDQDWADASQPSLVYFRYANQAFTFQTLLFEKDPRRMIGSGMQDTWSAVPFAD